MVKKIMKCLWRCIYYFFYGLFYVITFVPRLLGIGILCIFSNKFRQSINWNKPILPLFIFYLSFSVYLISIFVLSQLYVQNERVKYLTEDIIFSTNFIVEKEAQTTDDGDNLFESGKEIDNSEIFETAGSGSSVNTSSENGTSFLEVNLEDKISINADTVAWIYVNGTKVNYPVVQSEDNNFYLTHDFYKKENVTGWVFADFRSDFSNLGKNTIIYGHNLVNRTMFGSLVWLLRDSWYNDANNHFVKISTVSSNSIWEIFSVYVIEPEIYYLTTNFTKEEFEKFIRIISERSIYDFGIEVTIDDRIITLQTCNDAGNKRVVVHAKLVGYMEK